MQKGFFLRIGEGPHVFLMARDETLAMEPRENLRANTSLTEPGVLAWFLIDEKRWPVVRLANLLGFEADEWGYALIMGDAQRAVGIAVERVQQLAEPYAVDVRPFTPIGTVAGAGSIYRGVGTNGTESTLVLDGHGLLRAAETVITQ